MGPSSILTYGLTDLSTSTLRQPNNPHDLRLSSYAWINRIAQHNAPTMDRPDGEPGSYEKYCINCWSTPRCCSTSLMYSFAQRSDTQAGHTGRHSASAVAEHGFMWDIAIKMAHYELLAGDPAPNTYHGPSTSPACCAAPSVPPPLWSLAGLGRAPLCQLSQAHWHAPPLSGPGKHDTRAQLMASICGRSHEVSPPKHAAATREVREVVMRALRAAGAGCAGE